MEGMASVGGMAGMENELIRKTAVNLAANMNRYICKEGIELRKMELGLEIFLVNVSKLIIIYALAIFLGVVWQTLVVQGAFAILKRYSFGLHALRICQTIT